MSRFYDYNSWEDERTQRLIDWRWQESLRRALESSRGRRALADLVSALDALPKHELTDGALIQRWYEDDDNTVRDYEVCAIGAYALYKGASVEALPTCDAERCDEADEETAKVGQQYGMSKALARHIAWVNDEKFNRLEPSQRWQAVRNWAVLKLGELTR